MNRNTSRGRDTQAHSTSLGVDDLDSDAVTNDDFFASFSSQYEHVESSVNNFLKEFRLSVVGQLHPLSKTRKFMRSMCPWIVTASPVPHRQFRPM